MDLNLQNCANNLEPSGEIHPKCNCYYGDSEPALPQKLDTLQQANIGGENHEILKNEKIENNSEPNNFDLDLSCKHYNWVIKIE